MSRIQCLRRIGSITPLAVLFAFCSMASALGDVSPTSEATSTDMVCGPRCVQFLLRYYEKDDPGLVALIREIQWPHLEQGVTLAAIDAALRSRDIYTYPLFVLPDAKFDWPHPVLVHLNPKGTARFGHYVVWLPSSTASRTGIWSGLSGVREGNARDLSDWMSGAILLTSPVAVENPENVAFPARRRKLLRLAAMVLVGTALMFWVRAGKFTSWRRDLQF